MEALFKTFGELIPIGETERAIIAHLWREKQFKKGEHFLEVGKICRQVGFIEKGLVRYYMMRDGEEKTFSFGREGQFMSNFESFGPQIPSEKGIQALEDTLAYVISYDNLRELYATLPNGERFGRLAIEQVFVQALQELNSFYIDTPEQRYEKLLRLNPDLPQRIPQYYLASFIGIKPQSLSRIRKRISRQ